MTKPCNRSVDPFADTEPASLPMGLPEDDPAYAATLPLPLANVRPAAPPPLALAPLQVTLYDLTTEARRNNRVCPQPTRWLEFHRLLEEHATGAARPPAPLVGSAWAATPALAKRMCFREQLEWAAENNCIQAAWQYLKQLAEADWHSMA